MKAIGTALALSLLSGLALSQNLSFERTASSQPWNLTDSAMDSVCQGAFGPSYRLATWTEVANFVGQHGLGEFYAQSGMNQYRDNGWLRGFYSSNRRYFAERHDGNVPSGWAVHGSIGNNDIDLGSWSNSRPCLCVSDQPPASTPYCFGDGTGATCPCSAFGGAGEGCLNTGGTGASLSSTGTASFSGDTLQLHVAGVPGSKPGLILRGNDQVSTPAGDGILCSSGGSQRSHVQTTSGGTTTFSTFNGAGFGSVANNGSATNFQFWYRDPSNACSGAGFNFTNGLSVNYVP